MLECWSRPHATILLLTLTLTLTACEKPEWTDPEKSKSKGSTPAATAAVAPGVAVTREIPRTTESAPANPAWLAALVGKSPRTAFPQTGVCVGNTDLVVLRYGGASPGSKIAGWGWDVGAKRGVERVILVDDGYQIVGGGEGGVARADVTASQKYVTGDAGWHAYTSKVSGPVDAYGIVGNGQAICPLGHLVL